MRAPREFGDFQTPPALVMEVLAAIRPVILRCSSALEPTCGLGNFIEGLRAYPNLKRITGIEIAPDYIEHLRGRFGEVPSVNIIAGSIFEQTLVSQLCHIEGQLLIIGNPPWVTNATIGVDGGGNLPRKANIKSLRGIDAIMGESNFDIAEWIILRLLDGVSTMQAHLVMLCKSSVARNVVEYASLEGWPLSDAAVRMIDAKGWFNASVDACLFTCSLNIGPPCYELAHYATLTATAPERVMGAAGGKVVANVQTYDALKYMDGECHIVWRQGVKHDASPIMELLDKDGWLVNESGEVVNIEPEFIFPLYKGSDLGGRAKMRGRRRVIITQRRVGDDTLRLEREAPRLWGYLRSHAERFDARKSSIYRGKPPFSMFGIGSYTFTASKVAVSGLHKEPRFEAFHEANGGQPAVFDDTCYVLPCESALQAAACAYTLNSPPVREFLRAITFLDAKRPITKKVLERVDFLKAAERLDAKDARQGVATILISLGVDEALPETFSLPNAVLGKPQSVGMQLHFTQQLNLFAPTITSP